MTQSPTVPGQLAGHRPRFHLPISGLRAAQLAVDLLLLMAVALYLASPALNLDPWLIPGGREFEGQMASDALLVRSITQLGTVPLWNPYVKTGLPYISDPFTHLFNPLASVPALLLGPENGSKLGIALTFLFAGIGQYVLATTLGISRLASLWAGAMYMGAGHLAARLGFGHYALGLGQAWIPFAFAFVLQSVRTHRPDRIARAALSIAMLFFSGNIYHLVYVGANLLILGIWATFQPPHQGDAHRARGRTLGVLTAIASLAAALTAVQSLPMAELYPRLVKGIDPYLTGSQTPVYTMLNFVISDISFFGKALGSTTAWENSYCYIGAPALLFLLFLVPAWRRGKGSLIFLLILTFAFTIAWASARHTGFKSLYDAFPRLYTLRFPTNALATASSLLLALLAIGADEAYRSARSARGTWSIGFPQVGPAAPRPIAGVGPLQLRAAHGWTVLVIALLAYSAYDPISIHARMIGLRPRDAGQEEAIRWLRQHDPGIYFVATSDGFVPWGNSLSMYYHGVKYLNSPYGWRLELEYPDADHLTGRGILTPTPSYFISRSGAPPPHPEATLLKRLPGGDVYAMPAPLPYAFVAAESSMPYGRNPTPSPAVTRADARLENPNRVEVRVEGASPGQYLVVLEAHMPGWRVLVDGRQTGAAENVGGYIATPVRQGTHEYTFEFSPASFQVGLWVSLATALLLLWLMVGVRQGTPSPTSSPGDENARFEEAESPTSGTDGVGQPHTVPPVVGKGHLRNAFAAVSPAPRGLGGDSRLALAALLGLALASAAVYLVAFTLPMWLPRYHAVPHLDTPKILGATAGTLGGFVLAVSVLFGLYLAAYRTSFALRDRSAAAAVVALAALPALPLLFTYPGGAGDIYAYIAEADIVLRFGGNPFTTPAASLPGHPLLPFLDFPHETTHYGPLWLVIGVVLRLLAGGDLLAGLLAFKAGAAAFLLGTAWLVYLTVRRTDPDRAVRAALLVAWNPLLLFELAGNGHNDVAMMLFVLLAFYLYRCRSHTMAITALLAAALVKYVAIVLLPLFLVAMLRRAGPARSWLPVAAAYLVASGAAALLLVATVGISGTVGVLLSQSRWFTSSLSAIAHLWLSGVMPSESAAYLVSRTAQILFGVLYLVELRRVWLRPDSLARESFTTMLLLMLVAISWFQPWYATWAIPLGAVAATRGSHAASTALSFGAFMIHAVMGFAWRLGWNRGSTIAVNVAAVVATWLPTAAAAAALRSRRSARTTTAESGAVHPGCGTVDAASNPPTDVAR